MKNAVLNRVKKINNICICIAWLAGLLSPAIPAYASSPPGQPDILKHTTSIKTHFGESLKENGVIEAIGDDVSLDFVPPPPYGSRDVVPATLVQLTETSLFDPPSPDPAGIAYIPDTDSLLISDCEVNESVLWEGYNLFHTTLSGVLILTTTTTAPASGTGFSEEPTGVSYNPDNGHYFFSDDYVRRIFEVDPGVDGVVGTTDDLVVHQFRTNIFGSGDPEDVAYDSSQNHLFIIDGAQEEVFEVDPGTNGVFDGVPPDGDDVVSFFDVSLFFSGDGGTEADPEGIAYNPDLDHLYIVSNDYRVIAETSTDGLLLRYIDLSSFTHINLAGLAYGPSSTNPAEMHIYLVQRGWDPDQDPAENDGKLFEISFPDYVPPVNQPPTVEAGSDQVVLLSEGAELDGTASDDGLPDPPGSFTTTWSKVSGPGSVTFGNASAVDTTATFSSVGTYVLQLEADDSLLTASDDVTITVQTGPINDAPEVDAGSDQTIALPDSAVLDGTVSDDGLPDPPGIYTTTWSKVSGPGTVTFGDASAVDTTASFSEDGSYELQLEAYDGQLTTSDTLTITVHPENQAPYVFVGAVDPVTLPAVATLQGTVTDDGYPIPPGMVTTTWSMASGPWPVTFGDVSAEDTTASFSVGGTYKLKLSAYDGALTNAYTVTITVLPANQAPVVDAGLSQTITLPASATLDGTVTDDGYPLPGNITTTWSKISGPGTVTFGDASQVDTSASFSVAGTYVLKLQATDGLLLDDDSVTITVHPVNQAPVVDAGEDQTIALPASATLDGTVTDDGYPLPGTITTTWSVVSGPGTVTFGDDSLVDTSASFSVAGTYVLKLQATDGLLLDDDTVTITVHPVNQAPVVDAGVDQTITLPAGASLDGTVTDDGYPIPPGALTTTWSKVSGPGTVTFGNASQVDTSASFSEAGTYILKLEANDGALTDDDTVTITVLHANLAPVVDAGPNQTITLPANAALDGTVTDDGYPLPSTITTTWSVVSGPGTVIFGDPTAIDTTASFSVAGTYILQLEADDGALTENDQLTVIVEPGFGLYFPLIFKSGE